MKRMNDSKSGNKLKGSNLSTAARMGAHAEQLAFLPGGRVHLQMEPDSRNGSKSSILLPISTEN